MSDPGVTGRTYYVDPLHGISTNTGLSFGDAFVTGIGGLSGGLSGGDVIYLMASTADDYPDGGMGNQTVTNGYYGSTWGIVQVRGVNADTLEEDGSQYLVAGNANQYLTRFSDHDNFAYYNCTIVGHWNSYSSGHLGFYYNCVFTDSARITTATGEGGLDKSNFKYNFSDDNGKIVFRNCKFVATGYNSNYQSAVTLSGQAGIDGDMFESCEFIGYPGPAISNSRQSYVMNCRFIGCASAVESGYRSNNGYVYFINNIVDNTSSHAFIHDYMNSTAKNSVKSHVSIGNIFNNIGGYINYYKEATATKVDTMRSAGGQYNSDCDVLDWGSNIYHQVTTGIHSLGITQEIIDSGWYGYSDAQDNNKIGYTFANLGLTYTTPTYTSLDGISAGGLMLGTADDIVFNYGMGNSAGLGVFLHSFTEAIVAANTSYPEFGDVF